MHMRLCNGKVHQNLQIAHLVNLTQLFKTLRFACCFKLTIFQEGQLQPLLLFCSKTISAFGKHLQVLLTVKVFCRQRGQVG